MPGRIANFFRNLLRKRQVEQALDDELKSALEQLTQDKMNQGLSHPEAGRQALIELGGVEQVKEEVRATRSGILIETCSPTSPLAIAERTASPTIVAARLLLPSKKAMIPSAPSARDSHCVSPSECASVLASDHARLADAALISRSVYPFWTRHQSITIGLDFVTGRAISLSII